MPAAVGVIGAPLVFRQTAAPRSTEVTGALVGVAVGTALEVTIVGATEVVGAAEVMGAAEVVGAAEEVGSTVGVGLESQGPSRSQFLSLSPVGLLLFPRLVLLAV